MSRATNMTVGRPTKLILGLAVPLILTNVGQHLYTVADASIVGRGVGVEALAALGATDWLYWLVLWTVQAMTQGFSVLVSQTFGSNDKKGLRKAITMSVLLCAAVGILLTVVFVSSAGWLLHLLDTPENIYDGAHIYLTMMYAGTLITMAYNMAAAILRSLGDGKSPLIAMFTAGCLNIVLDLLFVIRFGWGIPGAAAAARQARDLDPEDGVPYFILAQCYASSAGSCGGFAGLATYWAAYDTMAKAVELLPADSEYMEHAKSSLGKFRSVFPSSEECFFNELQEGARYTVTCGTAAGITTTVRAR